jgi:hypothetical protein
MNPAIQRYLPPLLVFGAAMFFAWPPSAPLDLGDDIVRVTSVGWRPSDLADPPWIKPTSDPFQEVLVASEEMEVEPETGELVAAAPAGPAPEQLKAGLRLDGIANMGGRKWAVLNGRPRLPGDLVRTEDAHRSQCEIVSVHADHIVVRCLETVTEIRPRPFGPPRPTAGTPALASEAPAAGNNAPDLKLGDVPPPPPQ